jgi:hypothetical protein
LILANQQSEAGRKRKKAIVYAAGFVNLSSLPPARLSILKKRNTNGENFFYRNQLR